MDFFTRLVARREINKISRRDKARARKLISNGVTKIVPGGSTSGKNCFVCDFQNGVHLVVTPKGKEVVCDLCCKIYIETDSGFKPPPKL